MPESNVMTLLDCLRIAGDVTKMYNLASLS